MLQRKLLERQHLSNNFKPGLNTLQKKKNIDQEIEIKITK